MITIRKYRVQDIVPAMEIWNEVVRDGIAFPQDEELTEQNADSFFNNQSYTGIAEDNSTGELVGLYILHPNNVGRCGHICNTSYAVKKGMRGLHIGIAYAIWSALGIVLITLIGIFVFKQVPDLPAYIGLALIMAGVMVINLFSKMQVH